MTSSFRDEYVAAIEAENDVLRGRVIELETLLGMHVDVPLAIGLTTQEAKMFGLLMRRDLLTKEAAMVALYAGRPDGSEAEIKIVDVFICRIRRKLKRFSVEIETVWGRGWRLTPAARATAAALLQAESVAA